MFMDGNGNITGSGITNAPALLSFRRNVIPGTFSGTYDINPDGTGTFTLTVTIGDGLSSTEHINMVVMRAEVVDGIKLITEGFGASLEGTKPILGKPGGMVTFTATRLPD
jgi:hypothetical protein